MNDVIVLGGGISGLATAYEILRTCPDARVRVIEAEARAGGVLGTRSHEGFLLETAANGVLSDHDGALPLFQALGLAVEHPTPAAKTRWIYRNGRLHAVPTKPQAMLSTDLVSLGGKLRLLLEPWISRATKEESVATFATRRLGKDVARALLEPMTVGVWAGDWERISVRAAFPRISWLEEQHGSLFRAARAMGPAVRLHSMVPVGGMQALVDALAASLGERVCLGLSVTSLGRAGAHHTVTLSDGRVEHASLVVSALPAPALAQLAAAEHPKLSAALREIPSVDVAVVHVGVPRDEVAHALDGFGFLACKGENVRCLGCVMESSVYSERAPKGQVLLRLMYGGARDPQALTLSRDELAGQALKDLATALGGGESLGPGARVLDVVKWQPAIPQYLVGHQTKVAAIEALAADAEWILGGNALYGASVNDCVRTARRVAARVAELLEPAAPSAVE